MIFTIDEFGLILREKSYLKNILKSGNRFYHLLFAILLFLALVLRLTVLIDFPFTHDELSMLYRIGYDDFATLIKEGVLTDVHPAGIQVFYHYYAKWFGESELIIRIPPLLCHLLALYLLYQLSRKLFSHEAALLAVAAWSVMQYALYYSLQARPYAFGGLAVMLLVYSFYHLVYAEEKQVHFKSVAGMAIGTAMAAYFHHLAALWVVVFYVFALLLFRNRVRKWTFAAGAVGFLLYVPHLPIFFKQLKMGSSEAWLLPFEWSFLSKFLGYLIHFSTPLFLLLLLWLLWSVYAFRSKYRFFGRWEWLLLLSFVGTFSIILLYDFMVGPILQFSGLYFGFPLLLPIFFKAAEAIRPKRLFILPVVLLLSIFLWSLLKERQFLRIIQKEPYAKLVEKVKKWEAEEERFLVLTGLKSRYLNYLYPKMDGLTINLADFHEKEQAKVRTVLDTTQAEKILVSNLSRSFRAMAEQYFPYIHQKEQGYTMEYWMLSKKSPKLGIEPESLRIKEKSLDMLYVLRDGEEFGQGVSLSIPGKLKDFHLLAQVELEAADTSELVVVLEMVSDDEKLLWYGLPLSGKKNYEVFLSPHLGPLPNRKSKVARCHIWNKSRISTVKVEKMKLWLEKPNPYEKALFHQF